VLSGIFVLPRPGGNVAKRQLTFEALTAYCEPPHRTNIELVAPKSSETVLDSSDVAAGSQQASAEDEEQNLDAKHNQHQLHMRYYRCFEKTIAVHSQPISPRWVGCLPNYLSIWLQGKGRQDELELALDEPIVSISLGRSAVFVLGCKILQDGPIIP
jgi:hypothetical protein